MRRLGAILLAALVVMAIFAPWIAPNDPDARFRGLLYAPPTRVHAKGGLHIYPFRVVSQLERTFVEEQDTRIALRWFTRDAFVTSANPARGPLLLLGADASGRDVFSRLVFASRPTLLLAAVAAAGAALLGTILGAVCGYAGGWIDAALSRLTELTVVLPMLYVALLLRSVMPLVIDPVTTFLLLAGIFMLLGWPVVARGVRAIVASERRREYVDAARATGMSPGRVLFRHLIPAVAGHAVVQLSLLVPAFILAEATLSFAGVGFPDTAPTWGTLLQDAANVSLMADAPWLLVPAVAIFLVVLAVNLVVQGSGRGPVELEG